MLRKFLVFLIFWHGVLGTNIVDVGLRAAEQEFASGDPEVARVGWHSLHTILLGAAYVFWQTLTAYLPDTEKAIMKKVVPYCNPDYYVENIASFGDKYNFYWGMRDEIFRLLWASPVTKKSPSREGHQNKVDWLTPTHATTHFIEDLFEVNVEEMDKMQFFAAFEGYSAAPDTKVMCVLVFEKHLPQRGLSSRLLSSRFFPGSERYGIVEVAKDFVEFFKMTESYEVLSDLCWSVSEGEWCSSGGGVPSPYFFRASFQKEVAEPLDLSVFKGSVPVAFAQAYIGLPKKDPFYFTKEPDLVSAAMQKEDPFLFAWRPHMLEALGESARVAMTIMDQEVLFEKELILAYVMGCSDAVVLLRKTLNSDFRLFALDSFLCEDKYVENEKDAKTLTKNIACLLPGRVVAVFDFDEKSRKYVACIEHKKELKLGKDSCKRKRELTVMSRARVHLYRKDNEEIIWVCLS